MTRLLPLVVVLLLSGCGSLKFWGDDATPESKTENTSKCKDNLKKILN